MNFFFRRNFAKIPTPIELEVAKIELPQIRLRGSIFFYTPRRPVQQRLVSVASGKEAKTGLRPTIATAEKTVTLIYRGHTYERKL
jgi:hypothetical protein